MAKADGKGDPPEDRARVPGEERTGSYSEGVQQGPHQGTVVTPRWLPFEMGTFLQ